MALLWSAAAFRLHAWRKSATFTNGAFVVSTAAIAMACTWKVTSGAASGPSAQGDLFEHMLLVVAALATQLLLLSLRTGRPQPRAIAARALTAAVVLTVMATTYVLGPATAADVIYRVAFHGYLSVALVESLQLVIRYSRSFDDAGRKMNLLLIGWGCAVGLIYSASRLLYVLVDLTLVPAPTAIHTAGSAAALIGSSGIALGILAPRSVRAVQRWRIAVAATRRLDPLWRDLAHAFPDIRLSTSSPTTVHRAEIRYHRRLLEVAEGLARAHVCSPIPTESDAVSGLARALLVSRTTWQTPRGVLAAELLPAAPSTTEERRLIHALADDYRIAGNRTAPATSGAPA